jgi:HlyD family secretion protein
LQENELRLMKETNTKLSKYATNSGVIQSVLVKEGEQVSAFTPLMTINPLHPTMIVLYRVGQRQHNYAIGDEVSVSSYDRPVAMLKGKVIGYGSVMPLPDILQKSTAVKAFGQEVFIELPADNPLANGEKVLVR